jgi:hypothetical protein
MKKILAALTLITFTTSQTFAWTGGPWSGNTYDGNISGLFGGTMAMRDGNGIFRFTATETAQLGAFNSSMIYYRGITYLGSCQAQVDFEFRTVSGITNGSAYNRNNRPAQQQATPLNENDPSYTPGTQPGTQTINTAAGSITKPGGTNDGPVGIANSSWKGKLTSTRPSVRFKASGQAAFRGSQPVISRITAVQTGDLGNVDAEGAPRDSSFTITQDSGGDDVLQKPTNSVKVTVYGSRISSTVSQSVTSDASGNGTGGGGFAF